MNPAAAESASHPYFVEPIMPSQEIHLIYGPAGVGKTTLALQLLSEWSQANPVFDRPSTPSPFCYVACARSKRELRSHMRRLDLDPATLPHFSTLDVFTSADNRTFDNVLHQAQSIVPGLRVLFLDGLPNLCSSNGNDSGVIAAFLGSIRRVCQKEDLTIVAVALAAKARDGQGYSVIRERISGAANWSEYTGCKILLDFSKPRDPRDPYRTLALLPQTCPGDTWLYKFDGSRLAPSTRQAEEQHPEMFAWLTALAPDTELSNDDIAVTGDKYGMSRATVFRWISDQVDLGTLLRTGRGKYRKPSLS